MVAVTEISVDSEGLFDVLQNGRAHSSGHVTQTRHEAWTNGAHRRLHFTKARKLGTQCIYSPCGHTVRVIVCRINVGVTI
jgi:hypothetical protein